MEKSSFRLVFGNSAIMKVLDFFLDHGGFDYSLTHIAQNSDVSWSTLHEVWPKFEELKLVNHTRNVGRAKMYELNEKNPIVKGIIKLDKEISKAAVIEELGKQTVKQTVRVRK